MDGGLLPLFKLNIRRQKNTHLQEGGVLVRKMRICLHQWVRQAKGGIEQALGNRISFPQHKLRGEWMSLRFQSPTLGQHHVSSMI